MSEGLIVRRGGGGITFAYIFVTYPNGSVCTCTNGSKTITAKNTSGSWVFNIPHAGTWRVTATKGTQTMYEDVVISEKYQIASVTLSFVLFLYNSTSPTGYNKIITKGTNMPTHQGTYIDHGNYIDLNVGGGDSSITMHYGVDVTKWERLVMRGRKATNNANECELAVSSAAGYDTFRDSWIKTTPIGYSANDTYYVLDISEIIDFKTVGIYMQDTAVVDQTTCSVVQLYLEV